MHLNEYCLSAISAISKIDKASIEASVEFLVKLKQRKGRLCILGVGGSAANASHAVNDFRKIALIDAYTPLDNASELTARINDDGWEQVFVDALKCSHFNQNDGLMILSVGGGCKENNLSVNLIHALEYCNHKHASSITIVGRQDGYCLQHATYGIYLPIDDPQYLTPISESLQPLVWHAMVSHPDLKDSEMTWESINQND